MTHRSTTLVLTGLAVVLLTVAAGGSPRVHGLPAAERLPDAHRTLVAGYFDALNTAAAQGGAAQERLFASTQHPDFRDTRCALQGLTVTADPAFSTLRLDPDWHPPLAETRPRGAIHAIAATVTVHSGTEVQGSQIGTVHVVILDGTAYGFAPCPV